MLQQLAKGTKQQIISFTAMVEESAWRTNEEMISAADNPKRRGDYISRTQPDIHDPTAVAGCERGQGSGIDEMKDMGQGIMQEEKLAFPSECWC